MSALKLHTNISGMLCSWMNRESLVSSCFVCFFLPALVCSPVPAFRRSLFCHLRASFHLSSPGIDQYIHFVEICCPIKWLLAEMAGDISSDTLPETAPADIKDILLSPIFSQPQGYPLEWHTVLNFSIFSLTKLDFRHYFCLCFVICSYKLYQEKACGSSSLSYLPRLDSEVSKWACCYS